VSTRVVGLVILNALFLVAGQVCWKQAVVGGEVAWWKLLFSPLVWAGFGCFGLATAMWFYVLARLPLSQALPLQGITYFLGVLAGVLFFKETVSVSRWVGAVLIFVGVFLVARS